MVSITVIICTRLVAAFPSASEADHVMVVVPNGYASVNAWLSERTPVTVTVASQLSVANGVTTPGFADEQDAASTSTVISVTAAMIGAVLSSTVTSKLVDVVLPSASSTV